MDPDERLIISVVWRAVSGGINSTRMIYGSYWSDASKKCSNEIACESESVLCSDSGSSDLEDAL